MIESPFWRDNSQLELPDITTVPVGILRPECEIEWVTWEEVADPDSVPFLGYPLIVGDYVPTHSLIQAVDATVMRYRFSTDQGMTADHKYFNPDDNSVIMAKSLEPVSRQLLQATAALVHLGGAVNQAVATSRHKWHDSGVPVHVDAPPEYGNLPFAIVTATANPHIYGSRNGTRIITDEATRRTIMSDPRLYGDNSADNREVGDGLGISEDMTLVAPENYFVVLRSHSTPHFVPPLDSKHVRYSLKPENFPLKW